MTNEQLYDAAMDAVTKLFSDQSVSMAEAKRNLERLRDEIDILLDALKD